MKMKPISCLTNNFEISHDHVKYDIKVHFNNSVKSFQRLFSIWRPLLDRFLEMSQNNSNMTIVIYQLYQCLQLVVKKWKSYF